MYCAVHTDADEIFSMCQATTTDSAQEDGPARSLTARSLTANAIPDYDADVYLDPIQCLVPKESGAMPDEPECSAPLSIDHSLGVVFAMRRVLVKQNGKYTNMKASTFLFSKNILTLCIFFNKSMSK